MHDGEYIKWLHGQIPYLGGRSTLWSAWCPESQDEDMPGWPKEVTNAIHHYFSDVKCFLNVIPASEIFAMLRLFKQGSEISDPTLRLFKQGTEISDPTLRLFKQGSEISDPTLRFFKQGTEISDPTLRLFKEGSEISYPKPRLLKFLTPKLRLFKQGLAISDPKPRIFKQGSEISDPTLRFSNKDQKYLTQR